MRATSTPAHTILIADDEEIVRRVTRRILEHAGFRVVEAADPGAVVAALASMDVAVALVDLSLPPCEGVSILQWLRTNRPNTRVVLFTGAFVDERTAAAADAVLHKPTAAADLLAVIAGMLP